MSPTNDTKGCGCSACSCGASGDLYWCEYCNEAFPDKRCPKCGLKLKKVKR